MQRNRSGRSGWLRTVAPGAVALLAVLVLQLAGFAPLIRAGQLVFDAWQRSEPRAYEAAPVRVVDIDEESIRRLGQWPWPRGQIALLEQRLGLAGASAIALDIVFAEPDRTSPPRIAEALARSGGERRVIATLAALPDSDIALAQAMQALPVVNGFFLTNDPRRMQAVPKAGFAISGSPPDAALPTYRNAILPLPALDAAARGNGSLTLRGDADGIIHKVPLLARQGDQILPSLSLEALRVAQGAGSIVIKTSDGSGNLGSGAAEVTAIKVGQFEVPTTGAGELWMHYTAPYPDRVVPA